MKHDEGVTVFISTVGKQPETKKFIEGHRALTVADANPDMIDAINLNHGNHLLQTIGAVIGIWGDSIVIEIALNEFYCFNHA